MKYYIHITSFFILFYFFTIITSKNINKIEFFNSANERFIKNLHLVNSVDIYKCMFGVIIVLFLL